LDPPLPEQTLEREPVHLPAHPVRATTALVVVNVAVFALESYWGGSQWTPTLYRMGANAGRDLLPSEPWRVLSSAFLHIGPLHLLFNMWALWVFGWALERLLGSARLLVLYGLAALGGGLVSALGHGQHLSAGASGAVWGLMLAELVLVLRPRSLFEDLTFTVNKLTVMQPLIINLIYSLQPGIDMLGHLGGGATGALVMGSGLLARARDSAAWRVAATVACIAMALSIGLAFGSGRPWELRSPALETQVVPECGITLAVPRGLALERAKDGVQYGAPRQDPLVVECEMDQLGTAPDATEREAFLTDLARKGQAQTPAPGLRRVEEPAVVPLSGRPAYHHALAAANGVREDTWYVVEGQIGVRLVVTQLPGLPPEWRGVSERIAASLAFTASGGTRRE